MEKNSLQSGKGSEAEITCVVTGEPRPRVIWYKEGEVIKLTGLWMLLKLFNSLFSSGRVEAQRAGTRHVLVIHNLQESDYGFYMCYATNSMGSVQKSVEISDEDIKKEKLNIGDASFLCMTAYYAAGCHLPFLLHLALFPNFFSLF